MGKMNELVERWTREAEILERNFDPRGASLCRLHANELREALVALQSEALTLSEAANLTGYSTDHLGRLIREGTIPNAGRAGAPRIARRDLPRKSDVASLPDRVHHTPTQIVRSAISGGE